MRANADIPKNFIPDLNLNLTVPIFNVSFFHNAYGKSVWLLKLIINDKILLNTIL